MSNEQQTILLVDDYPVNLDVLYTALTNQGHRVLLDTNGASALETSLEVQPDLIILDVMMPKMDGFEVCRHLKDNHLTRNIPIIFMTALSDVVDEVKGLKLGAIDYIAKPIHLEMVMTRINTQLTLRRVQKDLEQKNQELQTALDAIKTLSGLIPICAWCGTKIQNDSGEWVRVDLYIEQHTEAKFTHGVCPTCSGSFLADLPNKRASST